MTRFCLQPIKSYMSQSAIVKAIHIRHPKRPRVLILNELKMQLRYCLHNFIDTGTVLQYEATHVNVYRARFHLGLLHPCNEW